MRNLNQMKSSAKDSEELAAKYILAVILDLEEEGTDDDEMKAVLDELSIWAATFRDSIGVVG